MKDRILSLLLVFVMTLGLAAPAFAAEEFLGEETAAQEADYDVPAAPEDPVPEEDAVEAEPAPPVEAEPEPEADYAPMAAAIAAPAPVAEIPMPIVNFPDGVGNELTQEYLNSQSEITLTGDVAVSTALNVNSPVTISSSGKHSIEMKGSGAFNVGNDGSLQLNENVTVYTVGDSNVISVTGGTLTVSGAKIGDAHNGAISVNSGTLNMTGGTVKALTLTGGNGTISNGEVTTLTFNGTPGVKLTGGKYGTITGTGLANLLDDTHYFAKQSDDEYQDPSSGSLTSVTVKEKKEATGTAPTSETLTYKDGAGEGEEQELVKRGSVTAGGDMLYALGDDDYTTPGSEQFKTEIPKGKEAKTYYVWWKIAGDNTHTEKAAACITVTINKLKRTAPTQNEGYTVDYGTETVTVQDGYQVTINSTTVLTNSGTQSKVITSELDAGDVTLSVVRLAGDTNHDDSDATSNTLKRGEYSGTAVKELFANLTVNSSGSKLPESNSAYQYAITNAGTPREWKTSSGGELTFAFKGETGYKAYVRNPATVSSFASKPSTGVDVISGDAKITESDLKVGGPATASLDGGYQYQWYYGENTEVGADAGGNTANCTKIPAEAAGKNIWYTAKQTEKVGTLVSETKTVGKGVAAYSVTGKSGLTFNGAEQVLIDAGENQNVKGGSVSFEISVQDAAEGSPKKVTSIGDVKETNAGKYTIKYSAEAEDGYEFATGVDGNKSKIEATINTVEIQKAATETTIAAPESAVTYGQADPVTLTVTVKATNVTAKYETKGTVTLKQGGETVDTQSVTAGDNGTWTATFTLGNAQLKKAIKDKNNGDTAKFTAEFAGDGNLEKSETSESTALTVNPKNITKDMLTFTSTGKDYDETATLDSGEYTLAFKEGTLVTNVPEDQLSITATTVTVKDAEDTAATDAGTYTKVTLDGLKLEGNDSDCYTLNEETSFELDNVSVEIRKVPVDLTAPTVKTTALTYSAEAQDLLDSNGTVTGGELKFAFKQNDGTKPGDGEFKTVTEAKPQGTEAGTYTVWYKVVPDKNHTTDKGEPQKLGEVKIDPFTVEFDQVKETIPYEEDFTHTITPTQAADNKTQVEFTAPATAEVFYKKSDGTSEVSPHDPGTYQVWVRISGSTNFVLEGGVMTLQIGTLTITHVHKWASDWTYSVDPTDTHEFGAHWHACLNPGCDINAADPGEETSDGTGSNDYAEHTWAGGTDHYGWETDPDDICSHRTCTVCGYVQKSKHVADPAEGTGGWVSEGAEGQHHQVCKNCGLPFDHQPHVWVPVPGKTGTYVCQTCGETHTDDDGGFPISGKVTKGTDRGNGVVGAKVTLTSPDGTTKFETETGVGGGYSFADVVPGVYTLTVETEDGVTVTKMVEVTTSTTAGTNIELPDGSVSSHVYSTGDSDIPAVIVDGLQDAAELVAAGESGPVSVGMTVEVKDESEASSVDADAVAEIKKEAGGQSGSLDYLNVTVKKTVGTAETTLDHTPSVITLVVPYDFSGKTNITVYRYHGTEVKKFSQSAVKEDGNFTLDAARGLIFIYADDFSIYAIGHTTRSYGGGGTTEADKSALDAAITAAGALNKDDYTEESWAALESALAAAKTVDGNAGATQEQVNSALSALTAAQNGLVKKGEEPGPGDEPTAPVDPPKTNNGTGWSYDYDTDEWYFFKNGKLVADYWVGKIDGASQWDNNWYYVGPDGKMLTGFHYLDDLKGGKAWYMLQTTNDKQEIGKMLTGWQWTYNAAVGEGWFSPKYGSQGMCTWNEAWGSYSAATGLWADGLSHKGA